MYVTFRDMSVVYAALHRVTCRARRPTVALLHHDNDVYVDFGMQIIRSAIRTP